MLKICMKYAINMQRYATPANIDLLWEYAKNMHKYAGNMQYMQTGLSYAEYARICKNTHSSLCWWSCQPVNYVNRECCAKPDRDNYSRSGQMRRAPRRIYNPLKCPKRMACNFFGGEPNGLSSDREGP
jgi:hypothetical protein